MASEQTIEPTELKARLARREELAVVDLRDEDTFSTRHLLMASCLPLSRLEVLAPRLLPRRSLPIVVCDDGGGLAELGHRRLVSAGYTSVSLLRGGIAAWEGAGFRLYSGVHVPSKAFAEIVEHECGTPHLEAAQVADLLKEGADVAIFDSRSYEEYHTNSIPTAVSVPGAELVYRFHDLVPSRDTLVVVNCGGRTRSIIGAQALINAGVPNRVCSLANGTMAWHLAGLDVVRGAERSAPPVSPQGLAVARERARAVAGRTGVETIGKPVFDQWQGEAGERTLHVIDVRSPAEFEAGHLPGSVNVPGGQLIQETDNWIASWDARIVLVDDTGVRALMTASWLRQMGYSDACVLGDALDGAALERGTPPVGDSGFPLAGPPPQMMTPADAAAVIESGRAVMVDVGLSKAYGRGHIPGAWHAVRSRLVSNLGRLPPAEALIFTSEDGVLARYAAAEVAAADSSRKVAVVAGGTAGWTGAGLPLEGGMDRMTDEADDVWYAPRDRRSERERHMREYLVWEIDLVNQLSTDEDCRFAVVT